MYFEKFPSIYYDFTDSNGNVVSKIVTDITLNVRARKAILDAIVLYDTYDVQDGETPEIVSTKFYNVPTYHWIIMLLNERYNFVTEWPMPANQLEPYTTSKYGSGQTLATHHWEDPNGFEVSSTTLNASPVTNLEYETRLNDKKRRIKIVSPEVIPQIISQLRNYI